jgi:alpha-L-rhamnosidase
MKSIVLIFFLIAGTALAALQPVELLTDYRINPLGIDTAPRLFWRADADGRQGAAQTAYQIQAAARADGFDGELLWDSGKVESPESTRIAYGAAKPASRQRVWWRVKLWDESGAAGDWSEPAWFEMALLDEADWQKAQWISCTRDHNAPQAAPDDVMGDWIKAPEGKPVRLFYKDVVLPDKPIVSAILWWGTNKPAKSSPSGIKIQHRSRPVMARSLDLAFHLKPGEKNRIQIALDGNPKDMVLSCGLRVIFADGTEMLIQSGDNWLFVPPGRPAKSEPVLVADSYGGPLHGKVNLFPQADLSPVWLRDGFEVRDGLAKARLYVSALGSGIAHLNGKRVGDEFFSTPQTDYEDFSYYTTHDVSGLLKPGSNALSILLDAGWYHQVGGFASIFSYGHPGMKALLALEYADGKTEWVSSGPDWQWKESAIRSANIYRGEVVDFRLDHDEWKSAGAGSGWQAVKVMEPLTPKLRAMEVEPVRPIAEFKPVKSWNVGGKTWMYDFGKVLHGVVKLKFDEPAGGTVRLRFSEAAAPGVMWNVPGSHWWCHGAPQNDMVISDGKPRVFAPLFVTKSFRYVEISGLSSEPKPGDVTASQLHTDAPGLFAFESSDAMLNRLFANGMLTHYNYLNNMFADLPRERCLWGAESIYSWATAFNGFQWAPNHRLMGRLWFTGAMTKDGVPGSIGLGKRITGATHSMIWSATPLFIAHKMHEQYNDLDLAEEFYDEMKHFLAWVRSTSKNGVFPQYALSDHAPPGGVPRTPVQGDLINALAFFDAQRYFARMAEALGKAEDAAEARAYADVLRKGILTRYDAEKHTFGNGTQDSLALAYGIFENDPAEEKALAASMVGYYRANGHKFDGGFMTYELYPMLAKFGYVDDALKMMRNPDYPGPAWSIEKYDATTYWERYFANEEEQKNRGLNFFAFAHPTAWMVRELAGIRLDPAVPGGRRLILEPFIPTAEKPDHVKASQKILHGTIRSEWKKAADGSVEWSFTIPANTSAEVRIPAADGTGLLETGKHVRFLRNENGRAVFECAAGSHAVHIPPQ